MKNGRALRSQRAACRGRGASSGRRDRLRTTEEVSATRPTRFRWNFLPEDKRPARGSPTPARLYAAPKGDGRPKMFGGGVQAATWSPSGLPGGRTGIVQRASGRYASILKPLVVSSVLDHHADATRRSRLKS